jgi:hypothetical protein
VYNKNTSKQTGVSNMLVKFKEPMTQDEAQEVDDMIEEQS